jgi:hypothetical protein
VTGIENGDSAGKSIVCSLVLRNKIGDAGATKLSYAFLEGSHQLVAVSGHGKINSWKRGAFVIGEGVVGHAEVKRTFGA